jgi:hypothetical protein
MSGGFWRGAAWLPRTALLLAGAAALVNGSSFVGLTAENVPRAVYGLHLAVMALGVVLFCRIGLHHLAFWRLARRARAGQGPGPTIGPTRAPRWLRLAAVAATAYGVALLLWGAVSFGEGFAERRDGGYVWMRGRTVVRALTAAEYERYQAMGLRLMSAWWTFFALLICWASHVVHERVRILGRLDDA